MTEKNYVAIIGMACRFPGADNPHQFWDNLVHGRSHISEIPRHRWDWREYSGDEKNESRISRWGGFIKDVDAFDAAFFSLSPLEVESMDPQQRIMLETAWSCLEDAALKPDELSGNNVGVFLGIFNLDYKALQERELGEIAAHHSTGTAGAVIANRISHFFNFLGPSVAVDTSSSASLHALHLAVQSLNQKESNLALAGGISLLLTPARHISFSKTGMLSPTGSCKAFEKGADGYVRGEGGGLVLLKPLADAIRDGDSIYGIIKGSAANHSGKTRTLTYPNDEAQARVVAEAILRASVSPETISYVEAHGTGTPTGDPVELQGLVRGFQKVTGKLTSSDLRHFCGLGSVKANIGHLESAAGIAGVIKVLLSMTHKHLPGLPNYQEPNPRITLENTPFYIVDSFREWKPLLSSSGESIPRRAGVSSFGFGGTNAHVILEEAPGPGTRAATESHPCYLVCLSARSEEALTQRMQDLAEWIEREGQDIDLIDVSATLLLGREHFKFRTTLVVRSVDELRESLRRLTQGEQAENCLRNVDTRVFSPAAEPEEAQRADGAHAFHFGSQIPAPEYMRNVMALAKRFATGSTYPWRELFSSSKIRRIHLPTYPFARQRFWLTSATAGTLELSEPKPGETLHQLASLRVEERVERDIKTIMSRVLKLTPDQIYPNGKLADYGFDSISNTQLAKDLSEHYAIEVAPTIFYAHYTLDKIKKYLLQEHGSAVERVYSDALEGKTVAVSSAEPKNVSGSLPKEVPALNAQHHPPAGEQAIAIIGMSGRFPQARTSAEFWAILSAGRDVIGPIPEERLACWCDSLGEDATQVKGGWLSGIAEFDPLFFEISPKEAETMDPRQRLLLQEAWRSLEDAGYGAKKLRDNKIGMFVGAEQGDYHRLTEDGETITSNHDGVMASRLAYFLNFSGPVLAINTACSAGLVAVHQACLSLRNNECDAALAAGVNLLTTPQFSKHASQAGMLSRDGVCYAFDRRANGMVMAEAVAVVVLKRLSRAVADGDRIHAVIRASGINYDGRTNGITAPSQSAQASLLRSVYKQFDINPAEIQCVVAHGTGTRLGDPIEVNALVDAFRQYTDKNQYCALISTKTHVGHTLAASGVVSLIGLVQALRNEALPASLHCEQESEYINWKQTPFYINKEMRPWPETLERRRLGAVSSFGISGTNAHVVVESYACARAALDSRPYHILLLSAKTEEALTERVDDLLLFLQGREAAACSLAQLSVTLLEGRHHFSYRCAVVTSSKQEAEHLLKQIHRREKAFNVFRGVMARDFVPQYVLAEYGNELILRTRRLCDDPSKLQAVLCTLADLYCQGYELCWENLLGDAKPPCISLPSYPFARQTYWADRNRATQGQGSCHPPPHGQHMRERLHPILDSNDSTLEAQKFNKRLYKEEFFLRDHVVAGKILLPGVAHLEMAYAAAKLSTGSDVVTLQDIIWGHPIVLEEESTLVTISLAPLKQDTLEYLIYTDHGEAKTVFSQGRVNYAQHQRERAQAHINIAEIQARCSSRKENAQVFAEFAKLGFSYGPTFQAIETLYCGETEALAKIVLADCLEPELPRFTMHPSLFDAALNTLRGIGKQDEVLRIPFSLETLVVLAPIPRICYCFASINRIARDGAISVNLSICDERGAECVRAVGLVFKAFAAKKDDKVLYYVPRWMEKPITAELQLPDRNAEQSIVVFDDDPARAARLEAFHAGSVTRVQSGDAFAELASDCYRINRRSAQDFDRLLNTLQERGRFPSAIINFWPLTPAQPDLTTELEGLLYFFQAADRVGIEREIQHLCVIPLESGLGRVAAEMLSGFARCMTLVNHQFRMGSLQLDARQDADALVGSALKELRMREHEPSRGGHEIRYINGIREERILAPWAGTGQQGSPALPLKERGVYLISGGAGELGLHIGKYMAQQSRARLVLLGRRALDAERREKLAALEAAGAEVMYLPCNVADRNEVSRALGMARERFGKLDGVFHCAGVAASTGVKEAVKADFDAVLAPKIYGTIHFDELTKEDSLDFFVLFSSIAAHVGDFGCGSYAAANRFLDAYAHYREALRADGKRHGSSISINWPYWDDGGMLGGLKGNAVTKALYFDYAGMSGLKTDEGLQAFLKILASEETQVTVVKGQQQKIEKVLRVAGVEEAKDRANERAQESEKEAARESAQVPSPGMSFHHNPSVQAKPSVSAARDELFTKTAEYLKGKVSQVFKIPKARIEDAAELGQYGIDSIQIMELTRLLGKDFESIPGTLFFEYRTIQELARYFTEHYAGRLNALLAPGPGAAVVGKSQGRSTNAEPATAVSSEEGQFAAPRPAVRRFAEPVESRAAEHVTASEGGRCRDIAIIGLSGRYPKAWNIHDFWKVLERGEDCVEEIPAHRWDKNKYYDPEKKPGKTNSKWGGFIDGIEYFDALFFNMSPSQAALTDPQGRLFLQAAWEAMEDAGYTRDTLCADGARKVGVYLGMMWNEYQLYSGEDVVLSDRAAAANTVSYFFNLHGQSLTVDTACSSSLYAIAMACESIRSGTSSLAFAGGANLSLHANKYVSLSQMNFFSTDGRCRSFGKGGTGYVPGEGVGCILLKPLDQAIADRDHIYGVIRGVAVSHGGKTNGLTVPNPLAQADMIVAALEDAKVSPEDISYIEGHGTGTSLGDPIEIAGLTKAFRKYTNKSQYCPIGSVKSNIGHLEGAAGVVAVTKVLLQMQHGTLVPSLHSEQLNPHIDFASTPFYVQQKLEPWNRPTRTSGGTTRTLPRLAGVSSFGAHGAIAHLIIQEYMQPQEQRAQTDRPPQAEIIVLSAKDDERLREKVQELLLWLLEQGNAVELGDIAYTLQVGREAMEVRLALAIETPDELREKLQAFLDGRDDVDSLFHGQLRQHKDTIALLKADEEMQEAVEKWILRGKHDKLMNLWVKGLPIDWETLARRNRPRRISLPTYPFSRQRHWLAAPLAPANSREPLSAQLPLMSPAAPAPKEQEERAQPLVFVEAWEPQALNTTEPRPLARVICFCSGAERQAEVAEAVHALDPAITLFFIAQGSSYRRLSPNSYELIRTEPSCYAHAFLDIQASHGRVDGMINLWALEPESPCDDFSDVVFTLQAIDQAKLPARRLVLAGQYHNGIERSFLEAKIGFERSIGLVMPQMSVGVVLQDLADPKGPAGLGGWVERLLAELQQENASSALYRDGGRFENRIRRATLAESSDAFKRGGTYLITGGCGGIGMLIAEHLARSYHANLILTGRSPLDPARQEKLHSLSAAGAQAIYVQADVCDENDMRKLVKRARAHFGVLHGVLHAAGVQGQGSILKKSMRSFQEIVAPKCRGTLVLDQALAGEAVDFICYISSTSAVLGDFGTCDYAVGNRFQMAYAAYRNELAEQGRLRGKAVVINWPLWRDGGMGFDEDSTKMYLQSSGQHLLETRDGIALLERLLQQDSAQHMVLVGKPSRLNRFLGLMPTASPRFPTESDAPVTDMRRTERRGLGFEQGLDRDLKDLLSRLVNVSSDKIYEDDNLADYGFDSVSLAELANRVSKHFGVAVTPSLFYGYSTLRKLKGYFVKEHKETLSAFYGKASAPEAVLPRIESPTRPRSETQAPASDDAIALIGMSGRFPAAIDVEELWSILRDGRDVAGPIGQERLALWGEPSDSAFGAFRCGQLPGLSEFDPLFFEISPKEARSMDPRQRLLLQEAWRALEDAGWSTVRGKVGMFVGVEQGDYDKLTPGESSITSNHDGMLAARLAYFLDFSGPVMAINTACSSGLVAVHQACMSIRNGECEAALAAGVSLVTTPQLFSATKQAGMLSDDGICYAFDKRARGMVIGEAVAVVVLKRLAKAVADGDRIHAVIRASGINYDGRSNGITAPNGPSQVALLRSIYDRYQVNPEDIAYVIAHGTGTRLGDPVEINALNEVFKSYTKKQQYCALTSIKPNIGHTLAASGVVSLIGAVQALRHEMIPASLHCEQESDYITWNQSPFYVNKTNKIWPEVGGRKRIAALSSFGMSGTNAHVVIESFPACGEEEPVDALSHLLALSAKSEESLQQRIFDLIAFLQSAAFKKHSLRQVSATLLTGRPHFPHRCAVVAHDPDEAVRLLRQLARREEAPLLFVGKVPKNFTAQPALQQSGNHLLQQAACQDAGTIQQTLCALADLYCQGYDLDWQKLLGDKRVAPVSLPGYPFVKRQCWPVDVAMQMEKTATAPRHPFIQFDLHTDSGPRLGAKFTGQEFFLRDHVVAGEKVFPGVCHLEMARAAHEFAVAPQGERTGVVSIRDVVWMRPIKVGDRPLDLSIRLEPRNGAGVRYQIETAATDDATAGASTVVHSQGLIVVGSAGRSLSIDLARLQAECSTFEISAEEVQAAYRRKEIHYGPAFQAITQLLVGTSQVLAKLSLPPAVEYTLDQFVLHPSLLDSALQASMGLVRATEEPELPYAVEALEILGPCTPTMWAWIRRRGSSDPAAHREKLDIDLCDTQGNVSVRISGFSTRPLKRSAKEPSGLRPAPVLSAGRPVLMQSSWEPVSPQARSTQGSTRGKTLLVGDEPAVLSAVLKSHTGVQTLLLRANDSIEALQARLARDGVSYDHIVWIAGGGKPVPPDSESLITKQQEGVYAGFRLAKALLALGYARRTLEWTVVTVRCHFIASTDRVDPTHAGVHGLMGSLAKEAPLWTVRLVDLDDLAESPLEEALSLPLDPEGSVWGHRSGRWYKQALVTMPADRGARGHGTWYRQGGVYIVIGGAGGLGGAWTEHMIRRYQAQVIWIGRRPQDERIRSRIDALALLGPAPWYLQADATDRESLAAAVHEVKKRFPEIHGVVHSAMTLLDQSVARMTEERFKAAMRAKVDVCVRMAQVFLKEPLDFVLFFSSLNSFLKSAGQSNYVSGCVFKDAFARLLAQSWSCAVKVMNWGYWGSVGAVASVEYHKRMEQDGIGSIEPAEGMAALDVLLSGPLDQLALVKTTKQETVDQVHLDRIIANSGRARGFDDDILSELLFTQLQALGMNTEGGGSIAELRGKLKPGSVYGRWLDQSLRFLSEIGYLECSLDRYCLTAKAPTDSSAVWKRWEALCWDSKGDNPYLNLLNQAVRECSSVLMGQKVATDVIFAKSSMSLVEGIYRRCDSADALNAIVADLVATLVESIREREPSRGIRIFEVGAGTGGTTEKVLQRLKSYTGNLQEYCFTDISKYFLLKGQREFGAEHPYTQYKLFNVEQRPYDQGFDVGSYDIVLATNVLHATRDVRAAVRHVRSLLRADGVLILNELAASELFSHLTFGLLEGWWLYEDPELRIQGCPGLSPDTWSTVLQQEGFPYVSFPASQVHECGHQIVVARIGQARTEVGTPAGSAPPVSAQPTIPASAEVHVSGLSEVRDHVQRTIVGQIQKSLSLDASEIHEEDAFVDYGVDSILGVQLIQDLNGALGVTLATTDLFDYSSVKQLAAYVADTYPDEIRASLARSRKDSADTPHAVLGRRADDSAGSASPAPTPTVHVVPEPPPAPGVSVESGAPQREAVAIIGMSGKFGKAKDVRQLWTHLARGDTLVEEITRWDLARYYSPGASYCNHASLMDDIDQFDPMFFRISGLEATYMDPQQRIVLEESWKALEDAGYAGAAVHGLLCGVYIGTQISDYLPSHTEEAPAQAMWGNAESIIPARISYFLDLQGPAIAVDTACSSSLVAVHLACQALRAGEVKMALAGGVSVQCSPDYYLAAQKAGMLSPTGRCYTFDERADGFVPAEGVGVVVLKRLRDALADGDHIYGLVRGSGLNQDGTSNGITAPSAKSQERLARAVYGRFAIDPSEIQMVEAHGTGTKLGDPIEIQALSRAFRKYTDKKEFCAIGSIKTNIGHAAPAAGMAGLIKILLALEHRKIPRSLHFEQGNAHIAFKDSPFYVNTVHRDWTVEPGRPRLAALSSFGFSGTNAHIVVEEAPPQQRNAVPSPAYLIVLSALSHQALRSQGEQQLAYLRTHRELDLGDVSLTLLLGRKHCPVRLACIANNTDELMRYLEEWLAGGRQNRVSVADLSEHALTLQPSLEQHGNACLGQCAAGMEDTAYREHLATISDLYLQGYELDYAQLFAAGAYKRVPLPTYPFERQRYWLPEAVRPQRTVAPKARVVMVQKEGKNGRDHIALAPLWAREDPPASTAGSVAKGHVVVIGGSAAERAQVAARCATPHLLRITSEQSVEEIAATLKRVGAIGSLLWIGPADSSVSHAAFLRRTDAEVVAFFKLLKALFALQYGSEHLRWTVVTRTAQAVLPGETVSPTGASVLGLVGVMSQEYPNWSVTSIDLGVDENIPAQFLFGAPGLWALRNGQWFRQRLAQVTLPASTLSLYRQEGVYVVLGGAGGIGELWTADVMRRVQAQVVWIGRREKDSAIQQKIDRLTPLGRPPLYISADASDRDTLRAAHALIKRTFGTINGVVQSTFDVVDRSLPNTSEKQFRQGLRSKIDVSVCMAEVFGAEPLDFMLFFSSIASFSQTMGYCSYVAGSLFVDAFARRLSAQLPYPVKVINWGYWGAVGSGRDVPPHVRERIYQYGFGDIDPTLAMDAIEQLLTVPLGQLVYLNTTKPEQFKSFAGQESIRVLGPAGPTPEALKLRLPSRLDTLWALRTQVKSKLEEFDALLARLIWCELESRGWFREGTFDVASFKKRNVVLDKYDRWLAECIKLFVQQGYLLETVSGVQFKVGKALESKAATGEWERSKREWLANPDLKASVALADRTLQALTDVLCGRIPAVDIIFPGSSIEFVEGIYSGNRIADYFNEVVGDCTLAWLERRLEQDAGAEIHILEIGAGTGGTTATVLRRIQPHAHHIREYCYTDLSRAFLFHGKQRFGAANPYLCCRIFDASKPLATQGFSEGTYDLIIATNVLHATKNICESLRNSKALLKPGGALIVNEIVGNTVFGLLTFALLDGWWMHDDAELRTMGGPGLTPQMWKSVLEREGFRSIEFPAADAHVLNQQVVVAVSDGVIRQLRSDVPAAPPPAEPHSQRATPPAGAQPAHADESAFKKKVQAYLKEILAQTLLIPVASIDPRQRLSAYGIDSILIAQLTNLLKKDLGEVSSTLFFEYNSVEALADYFVAQKRGAIARLVDPAEDVPCAAAPNEPHPPATADVSGKAADPGCGRTAPGAIRAPTHDIAIIGMSARFPMADTLDEYWERLRSGKDCITEIPPDRWALGEFYRPGKERAIQEGKSYSKWGGFLRGFADFDPLFFEISPNEAMEIDPQERLFLQETWKAFEDAGYTRARLERECGGQVGVFVGITRTGFNLYGPELWRKGDASYPFTSFGSVANRVSFKMNFSGPSLPIDTMCSSSLTAIHEACEQLRRGDCVMAVAGGVNLYLHPSSYINLCTLHMLSDDGKCRSFGRGGNGFVPGEGVGVLILKPLADAERDNDRIYAVIRGTSINHGGTTNGYTVPNPVAQGNVIRKALDKSGIDASTISYVEAHGTGTVLGDPIEINGLTRAFSSDTQDRQYCAIGSCKSNIGHAEAAAGIAGLCKVVLQMWHGELAPSLHADELNPHIDFTATPFVVQKRLTKWKRPVRLIDGVACEFPRRAGVSSFGAGGANAHVVLEEYTPKESAPPAPAGEPAIMVLSAKNEERLREMVSGLVEWLQKGENRQVPLVDIANTLQIGREAMPERLGLVVSSIDEWENRLQGFLDRPERTAGLFRGSAKRNSQALSALTADEDIAQILAAWMAKGKYEKVLELWVNGFELDWRMLFSRRQARIVSLPTYPFARERYWIAEKQTLSLKVEEEIGPTDSADSVSPLDKILDDYLRDELNEEAAAEKIRQALDDVPELGFRASRAS